MKIQNVIIFLSMMICFFLYYSVSKPLNNKNDLLFLLYVSSPYIIALLRNIFIFENKSYKSLTISALILLALTAYVYSPSVVNSSSTAPLVFLSGPASFFGIETFFCLFFLCIENRSFFWPTPTNPIRRRSIALVTFFFGFLGIHDFILGNKKNGFIKILLLFGSYLIIPLIILWVWIIKDLYHIDDGTYPAKKGILQGDGQTASMLAVFYLLLGVFLILITVFSIIPVILQ